MDIIKFLIESNIVTEEQVTTYKEKEEKERMKPKEASSYLSEKLVGKPSGKVFTDKQREEYENIMTRLKEEGYKDYKKSIDDIFKNKTKR